MRKRERETERQRQRDRDKEREKERERERDWLMKPFYAYISTSFQAYCNALYCYLIY